LARSTASNVKRTKSRRYYRKPARPQGLTGPPKALRARPEASADTSVLSRRGSSRTGNGGHAIELRATFSAPVTAEAAIVAMERFPGLVLELAPTPLE